MAQTSVAQFASELGLPAELLLEQLKGAGVNKEAPDDKLTEQDKASLLEYLRKEHGAQAPKNKITLTRKQVTEIKKSDSTGKARTIQVEVRKKRVLVRRDFSEDAVAAAPVVEEPKEVVVETAPPPQPPVVEAEAPAVPVAPAPVKTKPATKSLLSAEQIAKREQEASRHAELVALQTAEIRKKQELELKRQQEEAKKLAEAAAPTKLSEGTLHKPAAKDGQKDEDRSGKKGKGSAKEWADANNKRRTIKTRNDVGIGQGWRAHKSKSKAHKDAEDQQHAFTAPTEPIVHEVLIPETISVADLAHKMAVKASEVIKTLMNMGMMVTINQVLDQETAIIIVEEMGHVAKAAAANDPETFLEDAQHA